MAARVKVCPACGTHNPEDTWFCTQCRASLAAVVSRDPTPPAPAVVDASAIVTCRDCNQTIAANATECPYCHTPTNASGTRPPNPAPTADSAPSGPRAAAIVEIHAAPTVIANVTLRFPWGTEVLSGTLRIGRDATWCTLRHAVPKSFDNVSRRHAVITTDGNAITITDVGSSNGTFLNDQRLTPNTPARANVGDRIRFAANLTATIETHA